MPTTVVCSIQYPNLTGSGGSTCKVPDLWNSPYTFRSTSSCIIPSPLLGGQYHCYQISVTFMVQDDCAGAGLIRKQFQLPCDNTTIYTSPGMYINNGPVTGPATLVPGSTFTFTVDEGGGLGFGLITLMMVTVTFSDTCGTVVPDGKLSQPYPVDSFNGVVAFAWPSSTTVLKVGIHRAPSKQIGTATTGWDIHTITTTGTLNITNLNLFFMKTGRLVLYYTDGSGAKTRYSDDIGATWSTAVSALAVGRPGGIDRSQGYPFIVLFASNGLFSGYDHTNVGSPFIFPGTVTNSCWGGGLVYCGGRWICPCGGVTSTHLLMTSNDGITWTSATSDINTKLSYQVCTGVKAPDGTIVCLEWDKATTLPHTCRSRDQGKTWEEETATVPVIPGTIPPGLVSLREGIYAVYYDGTNPNFVFSADDGVTWL